MHVDAPVLYEDLFEATPSGLVVIDGAGVVAFVNRRAEAMLGHGRGELTGKPFGPLPAGADLPADLVVRRADGEEVTLEAIASRPVAARGGLVDVALRDVTG